MIAPANTGNDNNNKNAVIKTAQTNNGNLCINKPLDLIFITVVIKLIDPEIDAIPAKCKLNIAKSTEPPACDIGPASGGYTVQPVPTPTPTKLDNNNNNKDGGNNQKFLYLKK